MQTKPLSFRFIPWLPWTWKYNIQPTILVGSYIKHRKIMWTCSPRLLILVFSRECRVSEWSLDSQWVLGSWASAMESGFLFWKNLHRTQGISSIFHFRLVCEFAWNIPILLCCPLSPDQPCQWHRLAHFVFWLCIGTVYPTPYSFYSIY